MANETMISASGLGKAYRLYKNPKDRLKQVFLGHRTNFYEDFWALKGVDLELRRGETLGVIGENGAGKSTLLQLICGTLQPSAGNVAVKGRIAALLELGSGFNPQFTGRENVHLNAAILGLSKAEIAERFDAIAEFAGIGEFMDLPVKLYSSGMYARLAFAVCAHADADIMIVDEILSVGDNEFRQKCSRYLARFRERGTLLFVSHDSATVAKLCERALWLEHGQVRELGPAAEVCAHYLTNVAERAEAQETARGRTNGIPDATLPIPALARDSRGRRPNTIELMDFDPDAPSHGHGGAFIQSVEFCAADGTRLSRIEGSDEVELRIHCHAERDVRQPMVGFILRDRLGQNLFGDNTYLTYRSAPPAIASGDALAASFRFQLPFLASGEYGLTVAITEGTQEDHIHLHWMEDALIMKASESPVGLGIIGVPATEIRIEVL
jgi:lipopolysaccharide transport system ATP-binding protein